MSAQLRQETAARFRPMGTGDLEGVIAIERDVYPFPWTPGNFRDSLSAGYSCWVCLLDDVLVGYAILMLAAGEAHLLNIAVARTWQGRGLGYSLLQHLIKVSREYQAEALYLEVRPSNVSARRLYAATGFRELSVRRHYYPAAQGREDAVLMGLTL